jgi:hypothetical protein
MEIRRGLPGDPDDTHSRYVEAAVDGMIVGWLDLPNGNPAPGPKFDYKLRWFDRLAEHAGSLLATGEPVVLAAITTSCRRISTFTRRRDGSMTRCSDQRYGMLIAAFWSRVGLTRCGLAPGRTGLHLLEVFPERLRPGRRSTHRSSAPRSAIGETSHFSRSEP